MPVPVHAARALGALGAQAQAQAQSTRSGKDAPGSERLSETKMKPQTFTQQRIFQGKEKAFLPFPTREDGFKHRRFSHDPPDVFRHHLSTCGPILVVRPREDEN